jgi:hypothetical protein
MEKTRVGTKNLQKLLMVDDHELKLDSSFQSSGHTSLPDGDTALELRYRDRLEQKGEGFMESEAERVYEFLSEIGFENRINVYGNNVKQDIVNGKQMYTPHVALVGNLEVINYQR